MTSALVIKARTALALIAAMALAFVVFAPLAWADELSDVQAELAAKTDELNRITQEIATTQAQASEIDANIDQLLADISARQIARAGLQERISNLASVIYKDGDRVDFMTILTSSESLTEVLSRLQMRDKVLEEYASLAKEQQQAQAELELAYQDVSRQKDQQFSVIESLHSQKQLLDEAVASLLAREAQLSAEQQAALAAAEEAQHSVDETIEAAAEPTPPAEQSEPEAPEQQQEEATQPEAEEQQQEEEQQEEQAVEEEPVVEEQSSGWQTGLASAYGGSSDGSVPNPGTTATGAVCDDWSMGVAVPMAWGPESYYGLQVEIMYGGQVVVATVNDCGGMGGGSRSLDLQPGVFKAFGFPTCSDWGVREVQYRFL